MSVRTVFWLLVLAAGVALWAEVLDESASPAAPTTPPVDAARADRLLAWPLARVRALTLISAGQEHRIERSAAGWQYAGDATGDAVAARFIAGHLEMFAAARIERRLTAAPAALEQYGIGDASARVLLFLDQHAEADASLRIGMRTPDGFGQYVLNEASGAVLIVPAYQVDNLLALAQGPAGSAH